MNYICKFNNNNINIYKNKILNKKIIVKDAFLKNAQNVLIYIINIKYQRKNIIKKYIWLIMYKYMEYIFKKIKDNLFDNDNNDEI